MATTNTATQKFSSPAGMRRWIAQMLTSADMGPHLRQGGLVFACPWLTCSARGLIPGALLQEHNALCPLKAEPMLGYNAKGTCVVGAHPSQEHTEASARKRILALSVQLPKDADPRRWSWLLCPCARCQHHAGTEGADCPPSLCSRHKVPLLPSGGVTFSESFWRSDADVERRAREALAVMGVSAAGSLASIGVCPVAGCGGYGVMAVGTDPPRCIKHGVRFVCSQDVQESVAFGAAEPRVAEILTRPGVLTTLRGVSRDVFQMMEVHVYLCPEDGCARITISHGTREDRGYVCPQHVRTPLLPCATDDILRVLNDAAGEGPPAKLEGVLRSEVLEALRHRVQRAPSPRGYAICAAEGCVWVSASSRLHRLPSPCPRHPTGPHIHLTVAETTRLLFRAYAPKASSSWVPSEDAVTLSKAYVDAQHTDFIEFLSERAKEREAEMATQNDSGWKATLKHDGEEALYRAGGSQLVKLSRDAFVAVLLRNLAPGDEGLRVRLADFFRTPLGDAVLAAVLSTGLGALPVENLGLSAEGSGKLARELRVRALAGTADVVTEVLMEPLRATIAGALKDVRVEVTTAPPALDAPQVPVGSMPQTLGHESAVDAFNGVARKA